MFFLHLTKDLSSIHSIFVTQGVTTVVFGLGADADRNVLNGLVYFPENEGNIINIRRSNYNAKEIARMVKEAVDKACVSPPIVPG